MPAVDRFRCDACGHERWHQSGWLELHLDDGTLIVLPHPREDWESRRFGLTLFHASQRGRAFRVESRLCGHCGGEVLTRTPVRFEPSVDEPLTWRTAWWTAAVLAVAATGL